MDKLFGLFESRNTRFEFAHYRDHWRHMVGNRCNLNRVVYTSSICRKYYINIYLSCSRKLSKSVERSFIASIG